VTAAGTSSTNEIDIGTTNGNDKSSIRSVFIIDIHDYASTTKNKTVRTFSGVDMNGSGLVYLTSGLWLNTAAVNSVLLKPDGGDFDTGSSVALYGIN
jgi:hypothetical protein